MKKLLTTVASFLLCLQSSGYVSTRANGAVIQETSAAKISRLLEASGYQYSKQGDGVWTMDFKGKSSSYQVMLAVGDDLLVVAIVLAKKNQMKLTQDFEHKLLRANNEFDRVKIGIDDNGDLFVRIDASVRILDAAELKLNVDQVVSAADGVYGKIKTSLVG